VRAARPLTLALVAAAVAAPAAAASPLSLQVVNGRGVEQASFVQLTSAGCPAGCTLLTDGHVFRGAGGWNSRRLAPRVIRVSRE
jgi:hypothetical protein